ncbi:tyrosine-type recombinase/integrase [Streptomyces cinereoruber]|uniref:tyrosine-type recombinase/integrase n=1 Tax=Streptomyces cinereoruber TaxID=67260 RepID=UPI003644F779
MNKDGIVTSHQVKWRMDGAWQTETFLPEDDEAAEIFKAAVEEAGNRWPAGWVKGLGYVSSQEPDESAYRFGNYARRSIENRMAGDYHKRLQIRALENHIFPIFENCDVRSTEHFSKATISAWLNVMRKKKVQYGRGAPYRHMSTGTLRGLLKTLSSILKEAVDADPPLRRRNPCDLVTVPDGVGQDEDYDDAAEFMTPEEIAGLIDCFRRPADQMLVRLTYGTGLRWGEVTALAARHVRITEPGRYEVRVTRAWKRRTPTLFYLGPPKTKAGRRSVEITAGLWQELQDFGLAEQRQDTLIFHDGYGQRIKYGTFYRRWKTAVKRAKAKGVLPEWKNPTFHDLRHSHIAALISDRNSLTYIQRRVGHESIKTTSDRYGHLLDTAHLAALDTLDRILGTGGAPAKTTFAASGLATAAVYVATLAPYFVAFESEDDAERVAERWARDRGGAVRIEKMTEDEWAGKELPGAVRQGAAHRAWIWEMGPVFYTEDGSEVLTVATTAEMRGGWRWDFEETYTDELALQVIGNDDEKGPLVPVRAYGTDEAAVHEAFLAARAVAVQGMNAREELSAVGQ